MNSTVSKGYPGSSSEPAPLGRDQYFRHAAIGRWYDVFCPEEDQIPKDKIVKFWSKEQLRLNTQLPRILKAGAWSKPPHARPLSQDTVKRWEKAARADSYVVNKAAALSRCLIKVHSDIEKQLATLGQISGQCSEAKDCVDELEFLTSFHKKVMSSLQRSITDLSGSVFTNLATLILMRRDSYLDHVKFGVRPDTFATLRASPLHIPTLFAEEAVAKADKDITEHDNRPSARFPRQDFPRSDANHPDSASRGRGRGRGKAWRQFRQTHSQDQVPAQTKPWKPVAKPTVAKSTEKPEFQAKKK